MLLNYIKNKTKQIKNNKCTLMVNHVFEYIGNAAMNKLKKKKKQKRTHGQK